MLTSVLGGAAGGGGYSSSASSATSVSGKSGDASVNMGDFNFGNASGASSIGGVSPMILAAVALGAVVLWIALRRPSRG